MTTPTSDQPAKPQPLMPVSLRLLLVVILLLGGLAFFVVGVIGMRNGKAKEDRPTADKHIAKAEELLMTYGTTDEAIGEYSAAIDIEPLNAAYWKRRGLLYIMFDEFEKGTADLEKAAELDPLDTVCLYDLALLYYKLNENKKAIHYLDRAIKRSPNDALLHTTRAGIWQAEGEWKKAASDFEVAMKLNPEDFDAADDYAYLLATCPDDDVRNGERAVLIAQGLYEKTDGQWRTATTFASALAETGEFDRAIALLHEAMETAPGRHLRLGWMKHRVDMYRRGEKFRDWGAPRPREIDYEIFWHSHLTDWRDNLASTHVESAFEILRDDGVTEKAIYEFSTAIEMEPSSAEYRQQRALLYALLKQYPDAVADLEKAAELDSADSVGLHYAAILNWKQGKTDAALENLDAAIQRRPNDAAHYLLRAELNWSESNWGKAIADYERAKELGANEFATNDALAWLLATCPAEDVRNGEKALAIAQTAYDLAQQRWSAAATLAAAYAALGDFGQAINYQQEAVESAPPEAKKNGFLQKWLAKYMNNEPVLETGTPQPRKIEYDRLRLEWRWPPTAGPTATFEDAAE